MEKYRIKKWYSKDSENWFYTPQVKVWFLFWTYWINIVNIGYSEQYKAQREIDKRIKDINNTWPKDEIIEYPKSGNKTEDI